MSFPALLSWAWKETPPVHTNASNLLIHLFAVPLFVVGNLMLIAGIVFNVWLLIAAISCILVSLMLQNFGHSLERNPVHPFAGPRDFLRRLYAEQFCFSGQWYASFKAHEKNI